MARKTILLLAILIITLACSSKKPESEDSTPGINPTLTPGITPAITQVVNATPPSSVDLSQQYSSLPSAILLQPSDDTGVYLWKLGEKITRLSPDPIYTAALSPDSSQFAYVTRSAIDPLQKELRLGSVDGKTAPVMLYQSTSANLRFGWLPHNPNLWLVECQNRLPDQSTDPCLETRLVLLSPSGDAQPIIHLSSANIQVSPDGSWASYASPTSLGLLTLNGSVLSTDLLTYPRLTLHDRSGTSDFYPLITWQKDSSAFWLAVPDQPFNPDMTANPRGNLSLYQITTDGKVKQTAQISGSFAYDRFASAPMETQFSPGGKFIAVYGILSNDSSPTLYLFDIDGSLTAQANTEIMAGFAWSPDEQYFSFAASDGGHLLSPTGKQSNYGFPDTAVQAFQWLDEKNILFITNPQGKPGLYIQEIGKQPQLLVEYVIAFAVP
jgi:Tol biopolymer transport system component